LTPLQALVDPDGGVYLCCYYLHRQRKHCIGNIYEHSFAELWGTERHREAIASIQPEECNRFDCRIAAYNPIADRLIKDDLGQFQFI
jgi:radical SAM protein with 4Fe4S-binding SPASM domain